MPSSGTDLRIPPQFGLFLSLIGQALGKAKHLGLGRRGDSQQVLLVPGIISIQKPASNCKAVLEGRSFYPFF
jgi:hypothetical protein